MRQSECVEDLKKLNCATLRLARLQRAAQCDSPNNSKLICEINSVYEQITEQLMKLTIFLTIIAGIAVVWFIVSGMMIVHELMKRKHKINFIIINMMLPAYTHRYKKITLEETGKVGALYYHWLIAINTSLVFAVAAIVAMNL
jgi:hypothetical protein